MTGGLAPKSATARRREGLKLLIKRAFDDSEGTYGYRRIAAQLARRDVAAGTELARRLMRLPGLAALPTCGCRASW